MKVIKTGSMNIALIVAMVGMIAAIGCRSSDRAFGAGTVPPNGYLIIGEVRRPGAILSVDSPKTLLYLIDSVGGFTEDAYRKGVDVIHSGTTNRHNCKPIRNGTLPDPLIPLGARIVVPRAVL